MHTDRNLDWRGRRPSNPRSTANLEGRDLPAGFTFTHCSDGHGWADTGCVGRHLAWHTENYLSGRAYEAPHKCSFRNLDLFLCGQTGDDTHHGITLHHSQTFAQSMCTTSSKMEFSFRDCHFAHLAKHWRPSMEERKIWKWSSHELFKEAYRGA